MLEARAPDLEGGRLLAHYQFTGWVEHKTPPRPGRQSAVHVAWPLAHRLRVALSDGSALLCGPLVVDRTCLAGRPRNMNNALRNALQVTGRGAGNTTAMLGGRRDASGREAAGRPRPGAFGRTHSPGSRGRTCHSRCPRLRQRPSACEAIPFDLVTVNHQLSETVKSDEHTERKPIPVVHAHSCRSAYFPQDEPEALAPPRPEILRATLTPRRGHRRHHGGTRLAHRARGASRSTFVRQPRTAKRRAVLKVHTLTQPVRAPCIAPPQETPP